MVRNKKYLLQFFSDGVNLVRACEVSTIGVEGINAPTPESTYFTLSGDGISVNVNEVFTYYGDCASVFIRVDNPYFLDMVEFGTTIQYNQNTYFYDLESVKGYFGITCPILPTLNGIGGEYLDGETVQVVSAKNSGILTRNVIYTVTRSYHSLYADNAYVVMYDLDSIEGYKLTCPETLLVRYVEPVIAP